MYLIRIQFFFLPLHDLRGGNPLLYLLQGGVATLPMIKKLSIYRFVSFFFWFKGTVKLFYMGGLWNRPRKRFLDSSYVPLV